MKKKPLVFAFIGLTTIFVGGCSPSDGSSSPDIELPITGGCSEYGAIGPLNLRSKPSEKGKVIVQVPKGTCLERIGHEIIINLTPDPESGFGSCRYWWAHVSYNGKSGWAKSTGNLAWYGANRNLGYPYCSRTK